jgi:hypothetical protein
VTLLHVASTCESWQQRAVERENRRGNEDRGGKSQSFHERGTKGMVAQWRAAGTATSLPSAEWITPVG